jgi:hypothetical protein
VVIGGAEAAEQQALLQVADAEIGKEWSELRLPGSLYACSSGAAVREGEEGDEAVGLVVLVVVRTRVWR